MQESAQLNSELARLDSTQREVRVDCTPENIEQGLAGSLSEEKIEEMGKALMTLEAKVHELATHFGLTPADLNLDLGPLGSLLEK